MTVHDDVREEYARIEEERNKRKTFTVQIVSVILVLLLAIAGGLVSYGALSASNARQDIELEKQVEINTRLFRSDRELSEKLQQQTIILTELSVNLQTLMESRGVRYKKADR